MIGSGCVFDGGRGFSGTTIYPSHHKRVTGEKGTKEKTETETETETPASVWMEVEVVKRWWR